MAKKDALDQEILKMKQSSQDFEKFLKEQRETNSKLSKINNVLTLVSIVIILVFLWNMTNTVKNNFTHDKIMKSLEKNAPRIAEPVTKEIATVAGEVYPVYYELLLEKAVETMPEWSKVTEAELDKLSKEAPEEAGKVLKTSIIEAIKAEDSKLKEAFPGLSDKDIEELTMELAKELQEDMMDVSHHVVGHTFEQLLDFKKTLDGFDTKGLPDDEAKLSKIAISTFLRLLAIEVDHTVVENPEKEVVEGGKKSVKGNK